MEPYNLDRAIKEAKGARFEHGEKPEVSSSDANSNDFRYVSEEPSVGKVGDVAAEEAFLAGIIWCYTPWDLDWNWKVSAEDFSHRQELYISFQRFIKEYEGSSDLSFPDVVFSEECGEKVKVQYLQVENRYERRYKNKNPEEIAKTFRSACNALDVIENCE